MFPLVRATWAGRSPQTAAYTTGTYIRTSENANTEAKLLAVSAKAWNRRTARGKTREAFLPGKRTTLRFSKHVIRPSGTQTAISSRTKLRSFLGDAYFAAAWYVVVTGRRGRFAESLNGDGNAEFDASFGDNV